MAEMINEMDIEEAKAQQQNKYDRQLRLWGARGQAALGGAKVLLINAGPTGTETLKNLVLPSVGAFTVLDGTTVTPRDLANNFFVSTEAVGKPRAQVVAEMLCELNPDVKGDFNQSHPEELLATDPGYFSKFTLVIGTQLRAQLLTQLATICEAAKIPLLVARSYGLIGYVRVAVANHSIIESKPDPEPFDLRLSDPFPELKDHALSINMEEMDKADHGHTPYIIILIQLMEQWKNEHEGRIPQSFEEKNLFKESVKNASKDYQMELNFQEAYAEAYKAYVKQELPYEVVELFEKEEVLNITPESSSFCILVRALKQFMENEGGGSPPLSGQIPDMTGSTEMYIRIQEIYQSKAKADLDAMQRHVESVLETIEKPPESIPVEEIMVFCKNVFNIMNMSSGSISQEYSENPEALKEAATMAMMDLPEDAVQCPFLWYVAMRGADRFFDKNGHFPGSNDDTLIPDTMGVWNEMQSLVAGWEVELPPLSKKHAQEITRYGAAEIHNIAAIVGGIASQEAVKIITHQFVPVKDMLIYNGISGIAGVYEA